MMMKREQVEVGVRFRRDGRRTVWEVVEVHPNDEGYFACKVLKGKMNKSARSWWCLCQLCLDNITIYLPPIKQVRW